MSYSKQMEEMNKAFEEAFGDGIRKSAAIDRKLIEGTYDAASQVGPGGERPVFPGPACPKPAETPEERAERIWRITQSMAR